MVAAGKRGSIINMSSQMGHVGAANRTLYCASKWALEGFTKALAVELGGKGIRVNTICPPFIETPLTKPFLEEPKFRAEVLAKIKLGRLELWTTWSGLRCSSLGHVRLDDGQFGHAGWGLDGRLSAGAVAADTAFFTAPEIGRGLDCARSQADSPGPLATRDLPLHPFQRPASRQRFGNFAGDLPGRLREGRHAVIARLADHARQNGAGTILLAGDTFDTETPAPDVRRQALAEMAHDASLRWVILPGNLIRCRRRSFGRAFAPKRPPT